MNRRSGSSSDSGLIDPPLEPAHVLGAERRLAHAAGNACIGIGQPRPEGEQIVLQLHDLLGERGIGAGGARQSQHRVQLVDVPVCLDPGIRLAHTRAVEQRRFSGVARARVDLHAPILSRRAEVEAATLVEPAAAASAETEPWLHIA